MMNLYTRQLEQMIKEMNADDADYPVWLHFLAQVFPESEFLKDKQDDLRSFPQFSVDPDFGKDSKQFHDIREIMILAEAKRYPVWFIQLRFNERYILEYHQGILKNLFFSHNGNLESSRIREEWGAPGAIEGFSGRISGSLCRDGTDSLRFAADDMDRDIGFTEKLDFLKNAGIGIVEHVLFPTDKIPTISSSKLETFFQNYISKAQIQGLNVDGVVIISDTPLVTDDNKVHRKRIGYSPVQNNIHH